MMTRPFIVAELSANHNGTLARAIDLIDAAADAGADAVKLQTWTPEEMVGDPECIIERGPWKGQKMSELYRAAHTPWIWHAQLFAHARNRGLLPFSTPFDLKALQFLEREVQCEIYKVASFEIVDLDLITAIALTSKPMILSTGMATFQEISRAWHTAYNAGCRDITLLKCTSAYPTIASSVNLAAMRRLQKAFSGESTSVGISDHTLGSAVAVAATAMGASVVEKHLTLARADGGPDAAFSLEPTEFAAMVKDCRTASQAIGEPVFGPLPGEQPEFRRSLWLAKDIAVGERLTSEHVRSARPATGLEPYRIDEVLGRSATRPYTAGTPLTREMFK